MVLATAPIVSQAITDPAINTQKTAQRILQTADATSDLVGLLAEQECHLFADANEKSKLDNQDLDASVEDVVQTFSFDNATISKYPLDNQSNIISSSQKL